MTKVSDQKQTIRESFSWYQEKLENFLRSKNLKQTNQRRQMLQHALTLEEHFDAEMLSRALTAAGRAVGLATIYRNLRVFVDAGIFEENRFSDGRSLFEPVAPDAHHDHLICNSCKKVIEFEDDEIEMLQQKIARRLGFQLTNHRLDLFADCLKKDCPNLHNH